MARPDRHLQDDQIEYEYKGKTKTATANKEWDQIIATLSGDLSGKYTKIANRYKKIDRVQKYITKIRNELNDTLRDAIHELFPVADDIYTRVLVTKSMTVKLAKAEKEHTIEVFDAEAYIKELEALLPDMEDKLEEIRKRCVKVRVVAEKKSKLLTKVTEAVVTENINEFLFTIRKWAREYAFAMKRWLKVYDNRIDSLDDRIDAAINY